MRSGSCAPSAPSVSVGYWILGRRHLERVPRRYVTHYNAERPHRALALLPPEGNDKRNQPAANTIERHDLLGGLIHEYRAAA